MEHKLRAVWPKNKQKSIRGKHQEVILTVAGETRVACEIFGVDSFSLNEAPPTVEDEVDIWWCEVVVEVTEVAD